MELSDLIPEPTDEHLETAGLVLKGIKQIDPYFVNADMSMARGWARILGPSRYTRAELVAGVMEHYKTSAEHCMPKHVLAGAKRVRDAYARTPEGRAEIQRRTDARLAAVNEKVAPEQRDPNPIGRADDQEPQPLRRGEANAFMAQLSARAGQ